MNRSHQRVHVSRGRRNQKRQDKNRVDKRPLSSTAKKTLKKTQNRKRRQYLKQTVATA